MFLYLIALRRYRRRCKGETICPPAAGGVVRRPCGCRVKSRMGCGLSKRITLVTNGHRHGYRNIDYWPVLWSIVNWPVSSLPPCASPSPFPSLTGSSLFSSFTDPSPLSSLSGPSPFPSFTDSSHFPTFTDLSVLSPSPPFATGSFAQTLCRTCLSFYAATATLLFGKPCTIYAFFFHLIAYLMVKVSLVIWN